MQPRRPRVLLVDSSRELQRRVQQILGPVCELHFCMDGTEGLAALARGIDFDLVFADLSMAGVEAPEFYTIARGDYGLESRVVFLREPRCPHRRFAASVGNHVLPKPVVPASLLAVVRDALAQRRRPSASASP